MNNVNLEKIRKDEENYENTLNSIANHIVSQKEIKLVLIAGGSCAGKTTTTRKLSELITELGRTALTISLDDYYRNLDESVYLEDGTRDIESVNSLRVDLIRESFDRLLKGEEAKIPFFDFKTCFRTDDYRRITLRENDVVLIEGLHALDTSLFVTSPSENSIYRIYLFADAFDGSDCRFVRRMVRDARHRGASAEDTYALWDNVKKSERESIEPFRKFADVTINTFFPYERSILNDDAVEHLKTVSRDNSHFENAQNLIKILEPVEQWTDDYVPENSLLREFM